MIDAAGSDNATGWLPSLGRTLKPRHVEMISIGGIIGAGRFVGSSAAIARAGPSIVISYLLVGGLVGPGWWHQVMEPD